MVRTRATFASREEVARYLDGTAREEAREPRVRAIAERFLHLPFPARANALYTWVRRRVRYEPDPAGEEFDSTLITLARGRDDCDGSAKALMALALAAGLEARLRAVLWPHSDRLHLQVELRWPGSERDARADREGWILADTTLAGVELGQGAEAGRVDAAGVYGMDR